MKKVYTNASHLVGRAVFLVTFTLVLRVCAKYPHIDVTVTEFWFESFVLFKAGMKNRSFHGGGERGEEKRLPA